MQIIGSNGFIALVVTYSKRLQKRIQSVGSNGFIAFSRCTVLVEVTDSYIVGSNRFIPLTVTVL